MIAHIRPPRQSRESQPLVRARRLVASALLGRRHRHADDDAPRLPMWKIWLFIASMMAAIAVCAGIGGERGRREKGRRRAEGGGTGSRVQDLGPAFPHKSAFRTLYSVPTSQYPVLSALTPDP